MSTLASLLVKLGLDASEFHKGVKGAEGGAGSLLGTLGKFAGPTAILGGLAAVGKMAFNAGQQFDDATDTIVTKTGATGLALAGLQGDFKAVFTSIPTDAATASGALAEMATRTGATGLALQNLTRPLLEVSRLSGGDAATNAGLFARVMGDWGIPVDEGAAALDRLFVVTQKTGAPIDSLMQKVVQFGAPLRAMGFTLDEGAALFGKWEKEGVNAELVMGSLRIAAGKFAKEGQPLRESLLGTFDAIQKNTDASAALAMGMEVFGARAGPDMVAAIREGRFSIDDLTKAMGTADGAIMKTAASTADFPEKLTVLRNKVTTAMAPMGLALMDLITQGVEKLGPILDELTPMLPALGAAMGALGIAAVALSGPIGVIGLAIAALAAAWATDFGGIQEKTAAVWAVLQPIFETLVTWLQTNIPPALQTLANFWQTVLLPAITAVWNFFNTSIVPIFQTLFTWLQTNLPPALQTLANFWQTILLPAITAVWNFFNTYIIPLFQALVGVEIAALKLALTALAGLWQNVLYPALQTVWEFISTNVAPILAALGELIQKKVGPTLGGFNDNVLQPLGKAFEWISEKIGLVIGGLKGLAEKISNLALPSWLTPGSPTPLEIGLWGIADALAAVAKADVPLFQGNAPRLAYATAGVAGGGAGQVTQHYAFNITVNAPGGDPQTVAAATQQGVTRAGRAIGLW